MSLLAVWFDFLFAPHGLVQTGKLVPDLRYPLSPFPLT
jgi:hypothetical protein